MCVACVAGALPEISVALSALGITSWRRRRREKATDTPAAPPGRAADDPRPLAGSVGATSEK